MGAWSPDRAAIARDVHAACVWEATSRKVGNVHRSADFADTTYLDFILAAGELAIAFGRPEVRGVGELVLAATQQTTKVLAKNTHLGIVLLLAPLAAVRYDPQTKLPYILNELTVADAVDVFEAIRLANPGGLGTAADQDVRREPTVTLLEAMTLAADRDLVARQYANGFADVFGFGVPRLVEAFGRFGCVEAAVVDLHLAYLAEYPDTLVARKQGPDAAADMQARAREVQRLGGIATPTGRRAGVALDRHLRSNGNTLNPGATADLVAACLFVARRNNDLALSAPFAWAVPDWLPS